MTSANAPPPFILVDAYGVGVGRVGPNDFLVVGVNQLGSVVRVAIDYHVNGTPWGSLSLEVDGSAVGLALPVQQKGTIEADLTVRAYGNVPLILKHGSTIVFSRNLILMPEEQRRRFGGVSRLPGLLLQGVVEVGDKTNEGQLIEAVAFPWFEIVRLFEIDPELIYQLTPRQWEEMIAGAYTAEGFKVTLTPRSGDLGRDVIAERPGIGSVRFVDQVKRYSPGHLVTADEVRALFGVLSADPKATKGIVTTTSEFAPGLAEDELLKPFIPYRLELKPREILLEWLASIDAKRNPR